MVLRRGTASSRRPEIRFMCARSQPVRIHGDHHAVGIFDKMCVCVCVCVRVCVCARARLRACRGYGLAARGSRQHDAGVLLPLPRPELATTRSWTDGWQTWSTRPVLIYGALASYAGVETPIGWSAVRAPWAWTSRPARAAGGGRGKWEANLWVRTQPEPLAHAASSTDLARWLVCGVGAHLRTI